MSFKWIDKYSCNITEIDKQHKKLFEIGDRLYALASLNDAYDHYDEIMDIFNELKEYTIYHFDYEEKLMEKYGYQNIDSHKIEHMFLLKKAQKYEKQDIDADQLKSTNDLIAFVSDWITSHILQTDMQYKSFFNEKGIY